MKIWIIAGATFLALAIVLGAFGAHIIKSKVSPEDLAIFETGVRYQTYHALGLILIGLIGFHVHQNVIVIPALMITAGIIIFSGSLYILVLSGVRWLGSITPIGGLSFIAGWIFLAVNLIRN